MKLRAAIFDVYQTILDLTPSPVDRDARWAALWRDLLGTAPRLGLADFGAGCDRIIAREHAAARAAGIPWPEIFWPEVVQEIVPELAAQPPEVRADFIFRQSALWHTARLMPGAADVLRAWHGNGVLLGIASNAQPYTLRELAEALAGAGLALDLFAPDLCFWSFAHGFSKPDPHVFRLLTARLRARGVTPAETLMVGDRADNDVGPARAQGWHAWQLTAGGPPVGTAPNGAGGWRELAAFIAAQAAPGR